MPWWLHSGSQRAVSLLCVAAISYYYARAMLKGIASARDPNHRVRPQSPWFFFMREFKPRMKRLAWASAPTLVITTVLQMIVLWWSFGRPAGLAKFFGWADFSLYLFLLGCLSASSLGIITRVAPRIGRLWLLTTIGVVFGMLFQWVIILGPVLIFMATGPVLFSDEEISWLAGCGFILWGRELLYIRKKGDAWFRIED